MMRKLMLLVVLILLVVLPRCDWLLAECTGDSQCDDGNPCTNDTCESSWVGSSSPDPSWCDPTHEYWCDYNEIDDGTPCEVVGESGVCEAGACVLDGETSEPSLDGGVGGLVAQRGRQCAS